MNKGYNNYDKYPFIKAKGKAYQGYDEIRNLIESSQERIVNTVVTHNVSILIPASA